MSQEGQLVDKKSLLAIAGRNPDWDALVKDCVAFANVQGGRLLIGIEDHADTPAPDQRVDPTLVDTLRRKISERTVNVAVLPDIRRANNGGDVMRLASERSALPWEIQTSMHVPRTRLEAQKLSTFVSAIRASDRIKHSVKEKTEQDLLTGGKLISEGLRSGTRYTIAS